jgi:hypothetical protein
MLIPRNDVFLVQRCEVQQPCSHCVKEGLVSRIDIFTPHASLLGTYIVIRVGEDIYKVIRKILPFTMPRSPPDITVRPLHLLLAVYVMLTGSPTLTYSYEFKIFGIHCRTAKSTKDAGMGVLLRVGYFLLLAVTTMVMVQETIHQQTLAVSENEDPGQFCTRIQK